MRTALDDSKALQDLADAGRPENWGALKELNLKKAQSPDEAKARLKREAHVLEGSTHPSILRLLDKDLDEGWIVTQYHPGGTLADRLAEAFYKRDVLGSLRALEPVVEALAHLHGMGILHRDVKPENILISEGGRLILADTGLAFDLSSDEARQTATGQGVGSWQWKPTWQQPPQRDATPDGVTDCYGLAKILWCMIAGETFVNLHYIRDLGELFPGQPELAPICGLLRRCIVEFENQVTIRSGAELLRQLLEARQGAAELVRRARRAMECLVCPQGSYSEVTDQKERNRFGAAGRPDPRFFRCSSCGNVQSFSGMVPSGWAS